MTAMAHFRHLPVRTARIGSSEISLTLYRADYFIARAIGLLGSASLDEGEGLWLNRCSSIHTLGMRYAIDAIGVDKQSRIVHVRENISPMRFVSFRGAIDVIELSAGACRKMGLQRGDAIDWSAA